jgi:hypothetical protein
VRADIARIDARRPTWVDFTADVAEAVRPLIPFDAYCWHTVDPGTILFTGSVNRNVGCSGSWLAHYEYVVDDVNKWSFLAHSGRIAGATSIGTHGDLTRSARHRSHETYGFGDELRVALVVDGIYWGAAAFLRYSDQPWFTEAEVSALSALSTSIATGSAARHRHPGAAGRALRGLGTGSRRIRRERAARVDLHGRGTLDQ